MVSNSYIQRLFHWNDSTQFTALTISALVLHSCTHNADEEIAKEIADIPIETQADLLAHAEKSLESLPNLTGDQREQLIEIQERATAQSQTLEIESLKIRSLLVNEIMDPEYDLKKVARLKKRLRDIETEKLKITFGSVDAATKILGRETERENQRRVFDELVGSSPPHSDKHTE